MKCEECGKTGVALSECPDCFCMFCPECTEGDFCRECNENFECEDDDE